MPVVIAVLALIGIIVYALWRSNHVVPGAAVAPQAAASIPPMASVGTKAPPLQLKAPLMTITSQTLAGKPYLLEIFATWCPHCQRMTTVLRDIRRRTSPDQFAMVSVTGSPWASNSTPTNFVPENQQDVDAFDSQFHVTWPSIFDNDLTVAQSWGLNGFPTIYVVNARGTITYADSGEIPEAQLAAAIRKAGVKVAGRA